VITGNKRTGLLAMGKTQTAETTGAYFIDLNSDQAATEL